MLNEEQNLKQDIENKRLKKTTFRELEKEYGISYGQIYHITKGRFPKNQDKRKKLGLPLLLKREIPIYKIGLCKVPDCNGEYIKWAWNRKYCDRHSRSVRRKK